MAGSEWGSPPRMRGKAAHWAQAVPAEGITPAYAGKSLPSLSFAHTYWDHPRVCGEKLGTVLCTFFIAGSPPRMRGKVLQVVTGAKYYGITPAYAGKSLWYSVVCRYLQDHPRVCGEKTSGITLITTHQGSPPRMRGKDTPIGETGAMSGIPPAYAGKRLKRSRSIVPHAAIVPLFPSVCNKPAGSDGSPAGHDAPPFLPIENAAPASPAYNLRSL